MWTYFNMLSILTVQTYLNSNLRENMYLCLVYFKKNFILQRYFLPNIVLISAIYPTWINTGIHMSFPPFLPLPPAHCSESPPSTGLSSPCPGKSPLGIYFTYGKCACFHTPLSIRQPSPFSHWVHKTVLCVCLHCRPELIRTIFLDSYTSVSTRSSIQKNKQPDKKWVEKT